MSTKSYGKQSSELLKSHFLTLFWTLREWVSGKAENTYTHWCMTDNSAFGITTTRAWTRILAFLPNTCQMATAFAIAHALWFAVWWYTYVLLKTWARRWVINHFAMSIRSTRRWLTRIYLDRFSFECWEKIDELLHIFHKSKLANC